MDDGSGCARGVVAGLLIIAVGLAALWLFVAGWR